jgi:hypothetical protein
MKPTVFLHTVAIAILSLATPLAAQNPESSLTAPEGNYPAIAGAYARGGDFLPMPTKAVGSIADEANVIAAQDTLSLAEAGSTRRDVDAVVDLGVLRQPSAYRSVAAGARTPSEVDGKSLQKGLAAVTAVYRETEKTSDCLQVSLSVEQRVKLDTSKVLEIVESEVTTNPACSCETVKTAIKASEADVEQTVAIVETAIHASPESMRIISQCAMAANPEAVAAIQELLARLDPNAGESGDSAKSAKSAKDSKGAKVAAIVAPPPPNPLDLPPPGPPLTPPPIIPPPVTEVDPCHRHY